MMLRRALFWVLLAGLLAAHGLVAIQSLVVLRLWEDEAFNLTVILNLVHGLGYASDGALSGSTLTPFDPRISTGTSVLLPAAGIVALGGDPVIGARIVPLLYWGLLLAGLAVIGARIGGRWAALLAVAVPLAFQTTGGFSPIQGPADLLGEIPAAALLVWAFVVLPRRAWLAGLLVGLAIQAKLIAALALPAFAVALWCLGQSRGWRRIGETLRRGWLPLILAGAPTLLMEIAALLTLGIDGYPRHVRSMGRFLLSGGQSTEPVTVAQKLGTLTGAWFVPEWIAAASAVAGALLVVGGIVVLRRRGTTFPRPLLAWLAGSVTGLLVFVAWWASASHTPLWVRHPAPGVFAFLPILAACAVWGARLLWRAWPTAASRPAVRGTAAVLLAVLVAGVGGGIGVRLAGLGSPPAETLASQRVEVAPIREWVADTGIEWLAAEPWGSAVSMVVLAGAHLGLFDAPAMAETPRLTAQDCPGETLVASTVYRVCSAP